MDVKHNDNGQWHFSLGVVERWVVSCAILIMGIMAAFIAHAITTAIDIQSDRTAALTVQQAVTNNKLDQISTQLLDVPGLKQQTVELQVQMRANIEIMQSNSRDIRELRSLKGLK